MRNEKRGGCRQVGKGLQNAGWFPLGRWNGSKVKKKEWVLRERRYMAFSILKWYIGERGGECGKRQMRNSLNSWTKGEKIVTKMEKEGRL